MIIHTIYTMCIPNCSADKEFIRNDFTLSPAHAAERLKCNTSAGLHKLLKISEDVI